VKIGVSLYLTGKRAHLEKVESPYD
jgi:hypothetical protein